MSKIIEGNILNVNDGIVLHQVNCLGTMGAGVALALRKKYSNLYPEYVKRVKSILEKERKDKLLGSIQLIKVAPNLFVGNSFTQYYTGTDKNYTYEDFLISNIEMISTLAYGKYTIYVPYKIGCGLAGGNWDYIYKNIKDIANLIIVKLP